MLALQWVVGLSISAHWKGMELVTSSQFPTDVFCATWSDSVKDIACMNSSQLK